ncbi:hypothetical protein PENTCL1PPCAC_27086, partial [Pristionchus entomophagus]
RWCLLGLPINNILYTFILLFMSISYKVHSHYHKSLSINSLLGQAGVGVYLSCISHCYSIFSLLFLFRFSLIYKDHYVSSSLHGFLSSFVIFPMVPLILILDALYFSLPTFFHRPDSFAVDYVAPGMKHPITSLPSHHLPPYLFILMVQDGIRIRNLTGAMGTLSIILFTLLSFIIFSVYIRSFIR